MKLIEIRNDGPDLVSTSYWETEQAQEGYFFLSWNAGVGRLLVPASREEDTQSMCTARLVIVSRGPWADHGGQDGLELLFEDDSNTPYCLHLSEAQSDRRLPTYNQGVGFDLTVWTQKGKVLTLPGQYRIVQSIPCLEPWSER